MTAHAPATLRPNGPAPARPRSVPSPGRLLGNVGKASLLVVALVLTLGPVIWTVSTSFRTPAESFTLPPQLFPASPTIDAYTQVFASIDFWMLVYNSVLVTALITASQMFSAAFAGYVFARYPSRGMSAAFALVLVTLMVPIQVTIIPVFMIVRGMGLSDTLLALIIPAIPTAFGTFLMRQHFRSVPAELGEAAMVDGAGPWRTFFSVYLPLGWPAMAIVGVLAFNSHWNEFFRPLVLELSEKNFTLPLGLVTLQGNLGTGSVSVVLAGVVLAALPAIIVFLFGQRALRSGLTSGAIK
ncbi:carbohydrate ABC transporter permease [Herbiconiux moechotypicola]|uniref:Carbohydrate ABC transporter permease n=1 Tax=Herbiconiux moechotypicola TaxID=637393 RepID=A0ABN3E6W8_9MICO|nr:carbohydrate ABC transporter permease [Herbiconiux moechotypicola]MCS5732009.1 carbohydrate ABC transporter permease [Herbiconiux moechotypicola]